MSDRFRRSGVTELVTRPFGVLLNVEMIGFMNLRVWNGCGIGIDMYIDGWLKGSWLEVGDGG
jgi:hypothetical protein